MKYIIIIAICFLFCSHVFAGGKLVTDPQLLAELDGTTNQSKPVAEKKPSDLFDIAERKYKDNHTDSKPTGSEKDIYYKILELIEQNYEIQTEIEELRETINNMEELIHVLPIIHIELMDLKSLIKYGR